MNTIETTNACPHCNHQPDSSVKRLLDRKYDEHVAQQDVGKVCIAIAAVLFAILVVALLSD